MLALNFTATFITLQMFVFTTTPSAKWLEIYYKIRNSNYMKVF